MTEYLKTLPPELAAVVREALFVLVVLVVALVALNTLTNYTNHVAGTIVDFPAVALEIAA